MTDTHYPTSGKTTIAPEVLTTIARLSTLNVEGVSRLCRAPNAAVERLFKSRQTQEGVHIEVVDDVVYVDLYVVLKEGVNVRDVSRNIQRDVSREVSEMVGMQVGRVNVHIEDIDFPLEAEG